MTRKQSRRCHRCLWTDDSPSDDWSLFFVADMQFVHQNPRCGLVWALGSDFDELFWLTVKIFFPSPAIHTLYFSCNSCLFELLTFLLSYFSMDTDKLHELVTERAYPLVTHQIECKTIRWGFHGSLEPPRVVHVRCTDVVSKENVFAQVTVRFHTKQVRYNTVL